MKDVFTDYSINSVSFSGKKLSLPTFWDMGRLITFLRDYSGITCFFIYMKVQFKNQLGIYNKGHLLFMCQKPVVYSTEFL